MGVCVSASRIKETSNLDRAKTTERPRIIPLFIPFPASRSVNVNSFSLDIIRETSQQYEETIKSPLLG